MLPTAFINHGAGPFPLMGLPHHAELSRTWEAGEVVPEILASDEIKAIAVVSAHYESSDGGVEVMADPRPGLLFDYQGFPPETYSYTLDNPGSPALATRLVRLLTEAGIPARPQTGRGHDHGTFVPLLGLGLSRDRPALPVISVSLRGPGARRPDLEDDHYAMGRALAPLRSEGVLLLGSGNSIHGRCTPQQAQAYDDHLQSLARLGPEAFRQWDAHPMSRVCHPRPEHIVPLLVCAGAASNDHVDTVRHRFFGFAASHVIFRGT